MIDTIYKCYDTYKSDTMSNGNVIAEKLYKNGKLNIYVADSLDEIDGGVQERTCRWNSKEEEMPCYLYDASEAQGKIDEEDKTGEVSGRTPLAKAFISLADPETGIRYAVWPKQWPRSSGHMVWPDDVVSADKAIYRAAKQNEEIRCSPGRDPTPEPKEHVDYDSNDCAEGTYKPFGNNISNEDFSGENKIVEGWYDDSVPYRSGGTAADRHSLQVQTCWAFNPARVAGEVCWWTDV